MDEQVNILAFTGTRKGMTPRQLIYVESCLENLRPQAVHHGGCKGADAEFHKLCLAFNIPEIHVWWSNLQSTHMDVLADESLRVIHHAEQPPLDRDWDIVREADLVVACPDTAVETIRSGTWATVRYADQLQKRIVVVKPTEEDDV
jgi:hypothetical protein